MQGARTALVHQPLEEEEQRLVAHHLVLAAVHIGCSPAQILRPNDSGSGPRPTTPPPYLITFHTSRHVGTGTFEDGATAGTPVAASRRRRPRPQRVLQISPLSPPAAPRQLLPVLLIHSLIARKDIWNFVKKFTIYY
jgi:hypothetical protein